MIETTQLSLFKTEILDCQEHIDLNIYKLHIFSELSWYFLIYAKVPEYLLIYHTQNNEKILEFWYVSHKMVFFRRGMGIKCELLHFYSSTLWKSLIFSNLILKLIIPNSWHILRDGIWVNPILSPLPPPFQINAIESDGVFDPFLIIPIWIFTNLPFPE